MRHVVRPPSLPPEPLLQDLGPLDLVDVAHVREGDAVGRGRVRVVLLLLERRQPVLPHLLLLRLAVLVVLVVVVGERQEAGDVCGRMRGRFTIGIATAAVSDDIELLTLEIATHLQSKIIESKCTVQAAQYMSGDV